MIDHPRIRARPLGTAPVLLPAALAAWIVSVQRMRGMDAGPGTDLGGLGWFLGIWVTMTAAMMLPSAAPMVLVYSHFSRSRRAGAFVAGYLVAWCSTASPHTGPTGSWPARAPVGSTGSAKARTLPAPRSRLRGSTS